LVQKDLILKKQGNSVIDEIKTENTNLNNLLEVDLTPVN
jgi:hypothetical protein